MFWAEADTHCQSLGGFLPLPRSQEENDWLKQFGDTHLGVYNESTDSDTKGDAYDRDGQQLTYTNWRPGQPTGDGGAHRNGGIQLIRGNL